MKRKEILKEIGMYLIFALILYIFYRSVWAFLVLPPACIIYHRRNKKAVEKKMQELLSSQFKDALIALTAALRAGYSIENSLIESHKQMASLYGETSPIYKELGRIINEIHLGVNAEEALASFAERSGVDDINTFASVFSIARRSGGDLVEIIRKTSDDISSKIDTKNEIAVVVSSKRMEQNIMSVMPIAIIFYIGISSPSMLSPLYGNITGILVMTLSLGVYAAAYCISRKIMNIEV